MKSLSREIETGFKSSLQNKKKKLRVIQNQISTSIPGTTKLHHLVEDLGALDVRFTPEELREFRNAFSEIGLEGVRSFESALTGL